MMRKDFPYPYFFYGSEDSIDLDVVIEVPKYQMPFTQEERKHLVLGLKEKYGFEWNATLAVIENGIMVDTIYTKSWIDSLNNALLETYSLHQQYFPLSITKKHQRNKTLAIYKAVRTVLTMLTRTEYRTQIRPIIKGIHDFNLKLEVLSKIDFTALETFNQKNTKDADVWKIIAFYVGQNSALIESNIEIYTKKSLVSNFEDLTPFIYRQTIAQEDKKVIQIYISKWLKLLSDFGLFVSKNGMLYCNDDCIDMLNEKY